MWLVSPTRRREDPYHQASIPAGELGELQVASNPSRKCRLKAGRILAKSALPDHGNAPARVLQRLDSPMVSSPIGGELLQPELRPGAGKPKQPTILMAMPEAAIDEHNSRPLRENDVWPTREVLGVQSKTESISPEHRPHGLFRLGVLGPDSRHQRRSHAWFHHISHATPSTPAYEPNSNK